MASIASTSRSARYARWLAVPVGLVVSALLIWQASYAAFSDTTTNPDNSWTSGSVTITDTRNGVAMFQAADLVPGSTEFQDITVAYEGTLDALVKVYGAEFEVLEPSDDGQTLEPVDSGETLAEHIWLTIEGNEGDSFGVGPRGTIYAGTLDQFATTYGRDSTALRYHVAGKSDMTGTFRFTYRVQDTAPDSVQAQQVRLSFVAEAESTR